MNRHLLQGVFDGYNNALFAGADAVITAGLANMASALQILGVFSVAVFGYLMLTGNMTPKTGMSMMIRLVVVQAAMTPVFYNQYVRDVMLNWLPDFIAQTVGTASGPDAGAGQFDQLRIDIMRMAEGLRLRATGLSYMADRAAIYVLEFFCLLIVTATFFMYVFVRGVMTLVVSVGPFIIVAYLFNATRPFVENWIGKMVGVGILLLLISVLLKIIVVQFQVYVSEVDIENANLAVAIQGLLSVFLSMLFGVGLLLYLPRIAFSIGTGAAFDVASGAAMGAATVASAARAAGRSAAAGARAGARAAVGAAAAGRAAGRFAQGRFTR
ncbi:MAG: type IV secretion system protein [Acetobacteraceae bacterium]